MADSDYFAVQGELGHRPPHVPTLQLNKLPPPGQLRGSSRGANFSRPFTTSTQWPARMLVPNHYGGATERPNTREIGGGEGAHRNGIMTERSRGTQPDLIPDISNLNFQRGSTPMALYSDIFSTPPPGSSRVGLPKPRSPDTDVFGNPLGSARRASNPDTSREWQKMAVRISGAVDRMDEITLVGEALQALLGRHAALHVHWNGNQPANYVEMLMAEKPTSRKQAELLSAWLEAQVVALAEALPGFSAPAAAAGRLTSRHSESALHTWQALPKTELAKRLVGQSMRQPAQTFFHNHGHSLNVEGFGLPNDARFMRALLEITSVAAAAVIHQVAMHCHERGQVLSQVWNIHTSLMDMELSQLRFQVRVLSEEKDKFARQLNNANFYIRTGREKDGEIEGLAEKVKRLNGDLAIKEQELDTSELEVIRLQAIIESWGESGLSVEEVQEMQMEIVEMQSEKEEAEKTRDIALTALFAGVEKSITVGKGLQEIRESTFSQLGPGMRQEIDKVFSRIDADLKKITAMEDMVESKMSLSEGRLKANDTNFLMLMKAKTTAKRLKGLGKSLTAAKLRTHIEDENPLDKVVEAGAGNKSLKAPNIDIGGVVEDLGVSVIPEIMLEADMSDVDGMSPDLMVEEIQRLRERENTLLYTLNTMLEEKKLQAAEAEATAPSSPQGRKTSSGQHSGRGSKKGSGRSRLKADKETEGQDRSAEEEERGVEGSEGGSVPASPKKGRGEEGEEEKDGAAATRGVSFGVQGQQRGSMTKRSGSVGNRSSTFAESIVPRQDGKKDTIIMMMRALVSGRQQEVEARRLRALKTNKAASRLSTMAKQVAQEGLMRQLEERALHAEKLLAAYKHVHEEYVKLYNVMRSGSEELKGMTEPGELVAPEELGATSSGGDAASKPSAMLPATKKKIGVAQKARKALAAEAFAKATGDGKSGSVGKGKSRRFSKQAVAENETTAAGGLGAGGRRRSVTTAGEPEAPAAEKGSRFDAQSGEAGDKNGTGTSTADSSGADRLKTAGNQSGGGGGGGGDTKHFSSVLKTVRRKTFHGADDNGEEASAGSGGGKSGPGNTLGSMVMKSVRASPFACKDTALKEAMFKYKSLKPRAKEWVVRLIEKLYAGKAAQDAKHIQEGEELVDMPTYLFSHLQAQYGAKSLVQEYTASIVITMRQYMSEDIRLQSFARFLSQEWNTPVLHVFLDATERVNTYGALVQPCCEFPENYVPGRGLPGWVCTWKAMAISDVHLGRRSPECVAGFHKILAHYACPVDALERSKYFWSPALPPNATEAEREAAAAAEEAAKGQELSKLSVPRFLDCLCQEYNRAEGLLEEVVPMLFKDHDTDFSGFLNRREVEVMLRSLDGSGYREEELTRLWELAVQFEEASSDEMGHEPLAGGVGVHAFLSAVKRTEAVRRYIRFYRTPPPPEMMGDDHKASQSKMLYLIVERHWRAFEDSVDRILEGGEVDSSESALRGQITKMSAEQDGARRAQMFVNMLKTLCDIMLVRIQRQCNPSVLSNVFDPSMETNLEKVEKAVKVLYGWKTLLEDDTKTTAAILDPGSGLVARAKAVKDWVSQSKAFVEYKENMQRQAVVILQRKFAKRWWLKKQRANRETDSGSQRDILEGQSESAIPVAHIMKFLKAAN